MNGDPHQYESILSFLNMFKGLDCHEDTTQQPEAEIVTSTLRTICIALGSFALVAGTAASAQADVVDSATVTLTCKNYTIKVAGHGLTNPNGAVHYRWQIDEGSITPGHATKVGIDTLSVTPKADHTFTASATKPITTPPFDGPNFPIPPGTATLTTGSMTWNTVAVTIKFNVTGTFPLQCPSSNTCPREEHYWKNKRRWPVTGLVLGNFYNPTINYTDKQARAILNPPSGTDESLVLARELVTAKLNIFNGVPRIVHRPNFGPFELQFIFVVTNDADFLLGTGRLPQHVNPASSLGQQMAADAAVLESYNSGAFTPESPDEVCQSPFGSGY
jgi:hypothetical protein